MDETRPEFLKDYKRRAEATLPGRVARMVLFGSRARGDAGVESDWDVAVFLKDGPRRSDLRALADAAWEIIVDTRQFIQPVALPEAWPVDPLLARHIRDDGVVV